MLSLSIEIDADRAHFPRRDCSRDGHSFHLDRYFPTNKKLLDSSLDSSAEMALKLLVRWGRLHAVRSGLSLISFLIFIVLLVRNMSA